MFTLGLHLFIILIGCYSGALSICLTKALDVIIMLSNKIYTITISLCMAY
jgi:hypothetical protein